MPFGVDIRDATSFYYFTLIIFAIVFVVLAKFAFGPITASAASFLRTDPITDCILFIFGLADQLAQIIVAFS